MFSISYYGKYLFYNISLFWCINFLEGLSFNKWMFSIREEKLLFLYIKSDRYLTGWIFLTFQNEVPLFDKKPIAVSWFVSLCDAFYFILSIISGLFNVTYWWADSERDTVATLLDEVDNVPMVEAVDVDVVHGEDPVPDLEMATSFGWRTCD